MSIQSAKDFVQKIETDQALKERLEAAADHEARLQIIQAAGFDFTLEEFKQAVAELAAAAGQELSPEELKDIAAGTGSWCTTLHCWSKAGPCSSKEWLT
jgi:predicted ribosomally synthesized peptide with nif11-like leader